MSTSNTDGSGDDEKDEDEEEDGELDGIGAGEEQAAVEELGRWIVQRKQEDETLEILLGAGFV